MCDNEIMIIAPDTELYLLKCPLQIDEAHQLDFANATAQQNYFLSLPQIAVMNLTYQRDNDVLYFDKNIEAIRSYNYCMYKNKQYGNKWFYAYIVKMEYENNITTRIYLKTDVFQTYMFDYTLKKSFVMRETVSDDSIGANLYPESLEFGDYVTKSVLEKNFDKSKCYICMMVSEAIGELNTGEADYINGIARGAHIYAFDSSTGLADFSFIKGYLDGIGKGDAIFSLFMIPRDVTVWNTNELDLYDADKQPSGTTVAVKTPSNTAQYTLFDGFSLGTPDNYTLDGYTPVNNKLRQFPYVYFYASNNSGSAIDFKFEDFYTNNPTFSIIGCFTQGGDYRLIPTNSKRSTVANSQDRHFLDGWCEALNGSQMPQLAWESDYYLNWLAMNKQQQILNTTMAGVNFGMSLAGGMLGGGLGGGAQTVEHEAYHKKFTRGANGMEYESPTYRYDYSTDTMQGGGGYGGVGGMIGALPNLASNIASIMITDRNADRIPNSIKGNEYGGDITYSAGKYGFTFYVRTIKYQFAKRIDDYFSQFGYCVNDEKVPNTKSRRNWNYIQTMGVNITAQIPQDALIELKAIYNNGITIWHNPSNIYDYSVNNDII